MAGLGGLPRARRRRSPSTRATTWIVAALVVAVCAAAVVPAPAPARLRIEGGPSHVAFAGRRAPGAGWARRTSTGASTALAAAGAPAASSPLLAELLALAGSESDEGKVAARVDAAFGGLSPEDLTSLQAQLAAAPDEAAKKPMEVLTKSIQAAMGKRMEKATAEISTLLSSDGDINRNIKDCLQRQDSPLPIMTVLRMNLAQAPEDSQQGKALRYIFNVMSQELEKEVPPVLKVLSSLLTTDDPSARRKILNDHLAAMESAGQQETAKELSSAILELVKDVESKFEGQSAETPARAQALEVIRRTAIDAGVVIAEVKGDKEQDKFTDELGPLFEALSRT